jgi:hypothetical protein
LVELEKTRRSTTAALSERGHSFADARTFERRPTVVLV